jgi:hypothetical protein
MIHQVKIQEVSFEQASKQSSEEVQITQEVEEEQEQEGEEEQEVQKWRFDKNYRTIYESFGRLSVFKFLNGKHNFYCVDENVIREHS